MMTEEQRIEWLLELQDHSEQLTDEQLQQIHDDDEMRQLVQQLGFAKRAFLHDELKNDSPNVDDEWGNFVACHAEELDALDEGGAKPRFPTYLFTHKIAASFVGVLLASGIAFAAIQVVRNINTPKPQIASTEQATGIKPVTSLPADTVKADTIAAAPYIFNNVPLDSMLTSVADNLDFASEQALLRMVKYIEPVMIIIMAVIVGAIIIGVILPIYQSYSTIGAGQ